MRVAHTKPGSALGHWLIVPLTILTMALLIVALPGLTDRLDPGGWIPDGAESVTVDHLLASEFDRRATSHLVLLEPAVAVEGFTSIDLHREVARITAELSNIPGVTRVFTPLSAPTAATRESLASNDARAWLAVVQVEDDLPASAARLPELKTTATSESIRASITGAPALSAEFGAQVKRDLLQAELVSFAVALLVLIRFAGGARQAFAIVMTALTAIAILMLMITGLSQLLPISIFALSIAAMLAIALSLDFGLLAALRAEDRDAGPHIRTTLRIASSAVIAGMAGLTLVPIDAARSIGAVCMAAVGIVTLAQRFVLPVWLSLLRVGVIPVDREQRIHDAPTWLRHVGRHPALALLLGVAIAIPLIVPVARINAVGPDVSMLPPDNATVATLGTIQDRFPDVAVAPISIVAQPASGGMLDAHNLFALKETEKRLASLPGVHSVRTVWELVPTGISSPVLTATLALEPSLADQAAPLLTERGAVIEVAPTPGAGPELVEHIRTQAASLTGGELRLQVGGVDAGSVDLLASITGMIIPAAALVTVTTVVVLMLALRSIILPIKAVVLNTVPVLAGLGVVTVLFQLDTPLHSGSGTTVVLVPLVLVWLMFGISMDYEIFMLTRTREYRDMGLGNHDATLAGIAAARPVVLRGAVLMSIVFLAFGLSDIAVVRAIGIGVLVAIVVDATVVRMLLLPASMVLLGRWNWWWPSWLGIGRTNTLSPSSEPVVIGEQG